MVWRLFKKREKTMLQKAEEVNDVLVELGIDTTSETGIQLRSAAVMEIVGSAYPMMGKHGKATFIKQHGAEVMSEMKNLMLQEGILTKDNKPKEIEKK